MDPGNCLLISLNTPASAFPPSSTLWLGKSQEDSDFINSLLMYFSGIPLPTKKKMAITHILPFRSFRLEHYRWVQAAPPWLSSSVSIPATDSFSSLTHLKGSPSVLRSSLFCQSSILPPALHLCILSLPPVTPHGGISLFGSCTELILHFREDIRMPRKDTRKFVTQLCHHLAVGTSEACFPSLNLCIHQQKDVIS